MGKLLNYVCLHCKEEVSKRNTAGLFCSNRCQKLHEGDLKLKNWIENNERIGKWLVKRYLSEMHGNKCSCCNLSTWMEKDITLEIDHVDGNAYNNRPDNLRLLCPNCHSQTSTYKARNVGKGRSVAREGWLLL
jgi:endogenous inhibitor of DNA gyrase (YacG/DUF329 family)